MICAISLVGYLAIKIIAMPLLVRWKYKRYPNVKFSPSATLFKGDHAHVEKNVGDDKFAYWHYAEYALSDSKPDIYIKFIGPTPMFMMFSLKALTEMKKLQPNKIDRDNVFIDKLIGKIFYGSVAQSPSNAHWKLRRQSAMKAMGMNFASGYIQKLVQCMEEVASQWREGKIIDFTKQFSYIQFLFMSKVLFGQEFDLSNYMFEYETEKGEIKEINMHDMMNRVVEDTLWGYFNPLGIVFPFINDNNLCEPYKRIMRNVRRMENGIKKFLQKSDDKDSLYWKLKSEKAHTEQELMADLLGLLFAGSETTSQTTAGMLYFIKKNPGVMKKCKEVYENQGITQNGVLQKHLLTKDIFDDCEYADYVIKEVLRLNVPTPETISYRALENIEICGVSIPKGNLISIGVFGFHYDPKHWHEPLKFMPERFDPESEYFNSPSTGKARDPLCYIPFSTGLRSCPGQTLAKLTLKIALPLLLSSIDYCIDDEILVNDKVMFSTSSQYPCDIRIIQNKLWNSPIQ
ncbi:unnamed protein product [Moneuplotes crassus]|uniref:Cytochrome P450 n=1 Tax=Euplotes crassus TaxID=5936 RepID=A0AAD1UCA6_EUPCR|nr:unnamed protein product [Moneuplotes crassus]